MTSDVDTTEAGRKRLFQRFAELGISALTVPYPSHSTVEEGKQLRGAMPGIFTKNLLLRDRKNQYYLFSIHEDRILDLKTVRTQVGARGQMSFASAEQVTALLGVAPGALTPLALINDVTGAVTCVLDSSLLDVDQLNFHPLLNTESTGLRAGDLLALVRSTGREPVIIHLDE
ncbi:MAG: prolyl-tRNA synthetase associated domain-containing protein [Chloroflexota bacterium]|nr:prolyl-tRNA synthetase associated domain-containing protein [Chloroflexota bacterium]